MGDHVEEQAKTRVVVDSFDGITPNLDRSRLQMWFTVKGEKIYVEMRTSELAKNIAQLNQLCATPVSEPAPVTKTVQ
jgi:hypothetical protein